MEEYDVIIAGAGPAGLSAAAELSKDKNIKILLIEKRKKLGSDKLWTCWESELRPFDLTSVIKNKHKKIVYRSYLGAYAEKDSDHCIIDQNLFFKEMFSRINKENFKFFNNCKFISYDYSDDGKILISTDKGIFRSKLLIDSTGVGSPVNKRNNIKPTKDYYYVYAQVLKTKYIDSSKIVLLDLPFHDIYRVWFWVIPLSSKKFILGSYYFTNKDVSTKHAQTNIKKYLRLNNMKVKKLEIKTGRVYFCNFQKTYFDNILLVGDSAGQGVPANAYLFAKSLMFSKIAAELVMEALRHNDFTSRFLKKYEKRWKRKVILGYEFNYVFEKVIRSLNDEEVDQCFKIINKLGGDIIKRFEIGDLRRMDMLFILYSILRYFELKSILRIFNRNKLFYTKKTLKLLYIFLNPF